MVKIDGCPALRPRFFFLFFLSNDFSSRSFPGKVWKTLFFFPSSPDHPFRRAVFCSSLVSSSFLSFLLLCLNPSFSRRLSAALAARCLEPGLGVRRIGEEYFSVLGRKPGTCLFVSGFFLKTRQRKRCFSKADKAHQVSLEKQGKTAG